MVSYIIEMNVFIICIILLYFTATKLVYLTTDVDLNLSSNINVFIQQNDQDCLLGLQLT